MKKYFEEIMIAVTVFVTVLVLGAGAFVGYKIYDNGLGSYSEYDDDEEEDDMLAVTDDAVTASGTSVDAKPFKAFKRDNEMQNDTSLDDVKVPAETPQVIYDSTNAPVATKRPVRTKPPVVTKTPKATAAPTKKPVATRRPATPKPKVTKAPVVTPPPAPTQEPQKQPEEPPKEADDNMGEAGGQDE